MSIERTREAMNRYWSSEHQDVSMMADDVVFTHMATGDEHRGPAAVQRMLDYMYPRPSRRGRSSAAGSSRTTRR